MAIIGRDAQNDITSAISKHIHRLLSGFAYPAVEAYLFYNVYTDLRPDIRYKHSDEKDTVSKSDSTVAPNERDPDEHSFVNSYPKAKGDKSGKEARRKYRLLQLTLCRTEGFCGREGHLSPNRKIKIPVPDRAAFEFNRGQTQEQPL
jgi:hypothetical protein